ncbi:M56 family metallopeptidase [Mariniradius sediminis]|uniref:M56 family metallopeptidase n=2 Tax=Bacteroidota TaxID=976 RepID=A0ABS9BVJ0_9BACT|nr:M56 family metallopeptidase [Mariniradius sediminis]MCF1752080.1 M56 family metallopeptidase [Mariniradius sediminis]
MISFILISTLALVLFLLFYQLVLEKEKIFVFNRYFLLFTLALGFLIPFVELPKSFTPQRPVEILKANIYSFAAPEFEKASSAGISVPEDRVHRLINQPGPGLDVTQVLIGVYLLGLGFFFGRFAYQLFTISKTIRTAEKLNQSGYTIVLMSIPIQPFAFWKYLFLSKDAYEHGQLEPEIISHELCHIREKHTLDIILIEFLKVVFWFNPVFLLYKRYIQLNHEYLADDAVIRQSGKVVDYQRLLLSKVNANDTYSAGFGSAFHFSETKRRLIMIGKQANPARIKWLQLGAAIFVLTVLLGLTPAKYDGPWNLQGTALSEQAGDYEAILTAAMEPENPYILSLSRLDIGALKRAYDQVPADQKGSVTAFPFLEGLAYEKLLELKGSDRASKVWFLYQTPPQKQVISNEVFENWKKSKGLELEIDGQKEEVNVLDSHKPSDFALFEVRGIEERGFLKRRRYSVKLSTHAYYDAQFIRKPKKLNEVSLQLVDGERYVVYYAMSWVKMNEETKELEEYWPENYEASILHAFQMLDPKELELRKNSVIYDIGKQFSITVEKGKTKFFLSFPTI